MGLIATWYGILLGGYVLVPALKRTIQARVVEAVRHEFGADVRFQSFDVTLGPRIHIVASGVLIGHDTACPLIRAARADAESDLLPWHIRTLILTGLALHIPTAKRPGIASPRPAFTVTIDEIVSDHAQLEILPSAGRQTPFHFELANLHVKNASFNGGAEFSALIVSSKPHAEIDASGRVGPWNAYDPGSTPLQGLYTMRRGDLATLPGLRGDFASRGQFQGVVKNIEIRGDADTPDFGLSATGHTEPLHATFQAVVDAANGSASIEQMNGVLQISPFAASGLVSNVQDDRLRVIALQLSMSHGRLDDLLPLAVKSKTSPISGPLRVRGKLEIIPGDQAILDRLRLDADFAASNARFSSLNLRERLRKVSRKAQGHPNSDTVGSSLSDMQGHVRLNDGTAQFSNLIFDLEGASARLNGW